MGLGRRFPVPVRPFPLVLGWVLVVAALVNGLGWVWTSNLYTGNLLIQILIPASLFDARPEAFGWLVACLAGIALIGLSFLFGRAGRPFLLGPPARFYPLVFLLGLFITVFGGIFLFDASLRAEETPGGGAVFVFLNYAGLVDRPVQGLIGGLGLAAGLALCLFVAWSRPVRPESEPRPVTGSTPTGASGSRGPTAP